MSVNGASARFGREGEELVITPRRSLRRGAEFLIKVTRFTATPTVAGDDPASTAFFVHKTGSATAPEPYYAHLIYPSNDHPRDKASFTFRIDVPAGSTAVANGLPLASSADFIALAAQVSGRGDVVPFLREWLYGSKTPPMPGHPDWTTNPVSTVQAKAAAIAVDGVRA